MEEILENITVGGQSGGTTKAMAMTASPKMDVEVDKLILESGLKYNMEFQTLESAEEKGTAYLGDLGLDEAATLENLRSIDAEKLIDNTSSNYPGSMNRDGLYVTYESIQDSINDGVFDEISVLSGTNIGEEMFYRYPQQRISMHNTKKFLAICMINTTLKIW